MEDKYKEQMIYKRRITNKPREESLMVVKIILIKKRQEVERVQNLD